MEIENSSVLGCIGVLFPVQDIGILRRQPVLT